MNTNTYSTEILHRARGQYTIRLRLNNRWVGDSYSTTKRFAEKITSLWVNDHKYTRQIGQGEAAYVAVIYV